MANFPSGFSEINRALVDGDDVFVGNRRAQLSRFWTYVSAKLLAQTNYVTSAMLRDSSALSVLGRAANSVGVPADITATASSGGVFRESGGTLGFGTVSTAGIGNGQITGEKIAQSGTLDIGAASITTTGTVTTAGIKSSAGSPEGSVTAGVGAVCRDTTNGWLWQKESGSGNTGWRIIGASGSYTPAATPVSNLDSVSPGVFQWVRVGNRCLCFGDVTHDPTSSASAVVYRLSLPFVSNLTSTADLSGAGGSWGTRIIGDTANDQALVTVNNSVTTATSAAIYFGFEVK